MRISSLNPFRLRPILLPYAGLQVQEVQWPGLDHETIVLTHRDLPEMQIVLAKVVAEWAQGHGAPIRILPMQAEHTAIAPVASNA